MGKFTPSLSSRPVVVAPALLAPKGVAGLIAGVSAMQSQQGNAVAMASRDASIVAYAKASGEGEQQVFAAIAASTTPMATFRAVQAKAAAFLKAAAKSHATNREAVAAAALADKVAKDRAARAAAVEAMHASERRGQIARDRASLAKAGR